MVARQQRIRSDNEVMRRDRGRTARPSPTRVEPDSLSWAKARGFSQPVWHQAGRADHQGGQVSPPLGLLDGDTSEGLHRLAEASVVGEHAAQTAARRNATKPARTPSRQSAPERIQAGATDSEHGYRVAKPEHVRADSPSGSVPDLCQGSYFLWCTPGHWHDHLSRSRRQALAVQPVARRNIVAK